jgi:hypothetical protein
VRKGLGAIFVEFRWHTPLTFRGGREGDPRFDLASNGPAAFAGFPFARPRSRNAAWVLAAVSFVAMASGLTLRLHLGRVEDPCHHDWAHCSLCQTMLAGAAKLYVEPPSAVLCGDGEVLVVPEADAVVPRRLTSVVLGPRPPPTTTA